MTWAEDIADDVVLQLRTQMESNVTLGFKLNRGENKFSAWMGTILYRQALKAGLTLQRQSPEVSDEHDVQLIEATPRSQNEAINLAERLNRFPNTKKAIAHRMAKGQALLHISAQLDIPYKRVRMLANEIRQTLKAELLNN
ncbi:MAG: hypothetical protein MPJ50_04125 [Pirellulales bacterium]|nr:hypothetical protein [Pirellulales bacterium]